MEGTSKVTYFQPPCHGQGCFPPAQAAHGNGVSPIATSNQSLEWSLGLLEPVLFICLCISSAFKTEKPKTESSFAVSEGSFCTCEAEHSGGKKCHICSYLSSCSWALRGITTQAFTALVGFHSNPWTHLQPHSAQQEGLALKVNQGNVVSETGVCRDSLLNSACNEEKWLRNLLTWPSQAHQCQTKP